MFNNEIYIDGESPCCKDKLRLEGRYGGKEVNAYCRKCYLRIRDVIIPEEKIRELLRDKF